MLPHPLSRSAPGKDPPLPDLALLLERHSSAGFPPDLALDLVLNELVVRAADATQATAAALALLRADQMVCRAATGLHAPDLGVPLDTHDGLSGACLRTRAPQLSADTENDSRIDSSVSRRQGIRSMLIVPVFDHEATGPDHRPPLTGVLEVFSPLPDTFTHQSQILLSDFADECARICRVAAQLKTRAPAEVIPLDEEIIGSETENRRVGVPIGRFEGLPELPLGDEDAARISEPEVLPATVAVDAATPAAPARQPYEVWTLILGALVILAAAAFSFMIGSRIGWLRTSLPSVASSSPPGNTAASPTSPSIQLPEPPHKDSSKPKSPPDGKSKPASPPSDQLVVYDKNKVVFRMGPTQSEEQKTSGHPPSETSKQDSTVAKSIPSQSRPPHSIWLAPAQAESRLLTRVEPQYPPDALADHRSGNVTLEVHVAEDGTVSSVRTLNGDPLLAAAAADAVRSWRYQPYRANDQPSKFQTDVTLTFSLPN